jgi:hypothetical protein
VGAATELGLIVSLRQVGLALVLGLVLMLVCAGAGSLLTAPALARWAVQDYDGEKLQAFFALLAIRHLPLFLMAVAFGNFIFTWVRNSSWRAICSVAAPYMAYVIGAGSLDSIAAGEPMFSWVSYEPAYFIWPHFLAVPAGLIAASRMVARRGQKTGAGQTQD